MSRYVFCFRLNGIKNQSSSALALRSSRKSPLQAISNPYHFAFACYVRCTLFVVRCSLFAVVVVDVVALGFLWLHFEIKDMFVFFFHIPNSEILLSSLQHCPMHRSPCLSHDCLGIAPVSWHRSFPIAPLIDLDECPVLVPITLHSKITYEGECKSCITNLIQIRNLITRNSL